FFRLAPGREVRLRYAYYITCTGVVKDERTGEVVELRCTYDPATRGGWAPDGRQVKSTIHWVSAAHAIPAEVRLYDHLFLQPDPGAIEDSDLAASLNPKSLEALTTCQVEPSLAGATAGSRYQFERQGYFCVDTDTRPGALVFNRTVTLRDTWARIERGQRGREGVVAHGDGVVLHAWWLHSSPAHNRHSSPPHSYHSAPQPCLAKLAYSHSV